MRRGRFIAIEGGDGSGKATQAKLLQLQLEQSGHDVLAVSFPRYGQASAQLVEQYLNGDFGPLGSQVPELLSLAYAIDRYAAAADIRAALDAGRHVIADRYVASNLAHQAANLTEPADRQAFYDKILFIEYQLLGIPRPDLNLVLLVEPSIAQANIDQKADRPYTDKKRDLHEADQQHLEHAKRNYAELCQLYPAEFAAIDCMKDHQLLPIEKVAGLVQQRLGSLFHF